MVQSKATTVKQYLAELPDDRRAAIMAVRETILKNLPAGYEEGMQYGMIGYYVPHSIYPPGYHCDPKQPLNYAALASQKNHMAIYMMCIYGSLSHEKWFREAWAKSGKKLDMGKSCIRFKKLDDLPLDVIGQAIKLVPVKTYVEHYDAMYGPAQRKSAKKPVKKMAGKKMVGAKKAVVVKKKTRGQAK